MLCVICEKHKAKQTWNLFQFMAHEHEECEMIGYSGKPV